jgi:hypothetical protein
MENIEVSRQSSIQQGYPQTTYVEHSENSQGKTVNPTNGLSRKSSANGTTSPNFKSDIQPTYGTKDNVLGDLEG